MSTTVSPPSSGTPFWKIALGVGAGVLLAGTCAVGGCIFLIASGQVRNQRITESVIVDGPVTVDRRGDFLYVRGSVTNKSDATIRYWKVTLRYRDSDGNVVDTGYTNSAERLRPGESKQWMVMERFDPRIDRTVATVEEATPE